MHHIESERDKVHSLVRVLRLQRQIVAGVKYVLLIEIVPTVCLTNDIYISRETCPVDGAAKSEICQIEYIQKPWISKAKQIISNNCTVAQNYSPDDSRINNEINPNVEHKKSWNNKYDQDVDPERLADIESQIEIEEPIKKTPQTNIETQVKVNSPGDLNYIESQIVTENPILKTVEIGVTLENTLPEIQRIYTQDVSPKIITVEEINSASLVENKEKKEISNQEKDKIIGKVIADQFNTERNKILESVISTNFDENKFEVPISSTDTSADLDSTKVNANEDETIQENYDVATEITQDDSNTKSNEFEEINITAEIRRKRRASRYKKEESSSSSSSSSSESDEHKSKYFYKSDITI